MWRIRKGTNSTNVVFCVVFGAVLKADIATNFGMLAPSPLPAKPQHFPPPHRSEER